MGVVEPKSFKMLKRDMDRIMAGRTKEEVKMFAAEIVKAAKSESRRVLTAEPPGKYSGKTRSIKYAEDWDSYQFGDSTFVGNDSPAALVHEFGSTSSSLRRSGKKSQKATRKDKYKSGKAQASRTVEITPKKVLARALNIALDKTWSWRSKKKSLDGKALK